MRGFLEIAAVVVLTAGCLWWIYRGAVRGTGLANTVGMAGVKAFVWVVSCLFVLGLLARDADLTFTEMPGNLAVVGAFACILLLAASALLNLREIGVSRQEQRLRGIPPEPRMLNPWIPALLAGFASFVAVIAALLILSLAAVQSQALQQLAEGATFSSLAETPANPTWVQDSVVWLAGGCVLITALTYGVQWVRRARAWREYDELSTGINDRITTALVRQEHTIQDG